MKKRILNLAALINNNKQQILSSQEEMARIEKKIDDKHQKKLQLKG